MTFHEFGDRGNPHIMLIHGGGNAWWNYLRQAWALSHSYHVILPTMDGHGEEYAVPYISTEDTADKLMAYIEENCNGHLFALCGVSLGGQIVMELLSRKADLTEKAIIDGSVCYPRPAMAHFCMAAIKLFGGILLSEKFCHRQIAQMPNSEDIKAYYIQDIPRVRKETLHTIYRTYMMEYALKESVQNSQAQVMYWYGEKEMKWIKESALMFKSFVPSCKIYEAKGCKHGHLALYKPEEWLAIATDFFWQ